METMANIIPEETETIIEEVVETSAKKFTLPRGVKIAAGVGITAAVGYLAYRFIVKPTIAKVKTAKEEWKEIHDFIDNGLEDNIIEADLEDSEPMETA